MPSKKILLMDDSQEVLDLLELVVTNAGYEAILMNSAINVYETAVKEKPDLIILDILMKELSGITICEKIRENPEFNETPVFLLTARSHVSDKLKGISAGATEYIVKPASGKRLLELIKTYIGVSE